MAAEQEVERLVVRLTGDGSDFNRMMTNAQKVSNDTADKVEDSSKRIEQQGESLKRYASTAAQAIGTYLGAATFKGLFDAYSTQEAAEMRLRAALQVNKREVESTLQTYISFSSELQRVTTQGDEVTLVMLQQAEAYGLTGTAAQEAVKNAVALSQALNKTGDEALIAAAKFQAGDVNALNELFPTLIAIKDESARVAEGQKLLANTFAIAEEQARTAAGRVSQLSNSWGDFQEQLGKTVADGIQPVVSGLQSTVGWLQELSPEIKEAIVITGGVAVAVTALSAAYGVLSLALGPARALIATTTARLAAMATSTRAATAASMALRGGLILGAVYGIKELTFAAAGGNEALKDLNEQMERSDRLSQQLREVRERTAGRFFEQANTIGDASVRLQAFRAELERTERNAEGLTRHLENAKRQVSDADDLRRQIPWFGEGWESEFNQAQDAVRGFQNELDRTNDHAKRVRDEIERINRELKEQGDRRAMGQFERERAFAEQMAQKDLERKVALEQELNDLLADYRLQWQTIDMSDHEAIMFRLHQLMENQVFEGEQLTEVFREQIALINVFANALEGERAKISLVDSVEELTKSLEFQMATLGMTNAEIDIYRIKTEAARLNLNKLVKEELEHAEALSREIELTDRARQITEQYLTPLDRYNRTVDELLELRRKGLIAERTFNDAMTDAKSRFVESAIPRLPSTDR